MMDEQTQNIYNDAKTKHLKELVQHSFVNKKFDINVFARYIIKDCIELADGLELLNYSDTADQWDIGYRDAVKDVTDLLVERYEP